MKYEFTLPNSISKSIVDEAALVEKLSDSHSSFLAGSLLIAYRRENADRPALSKWRNTYRSLEARWHLRRYAPPETTKYTFDLELE